MKKRISLIMALLLALGSLTMLAACDKDEPVSKVETQDTPPSDENTVKNPDGGTTSDAQDPAQTGENDTESDTRIPENSDKNETIKYTVDRIEDFNEGIVVYQGTVTAKDGSQTVGFGYIDSKGQVITPPIYQKASVFYNGLAAVKKGENQLGYIDTTGKEVIPCIYSSVAVYFDTLAWVTTAEGVEQMINVKGEVVYTATGKEVAKGYYDNGFFWVETEEVTLAGNIPTLTYYNEKGEVAFALENTRHAESGGSFNGSDFNEYGYAFVCQKTTDYSSYDLEEDRHLMINKEGQFCHWIFEGKDFGEYGGPCIEFLFDENILMQYDGDMEIEGRGYGDVYYIDWQNQRILPTEMRYSRNPCDYGYSLGNGYFWESLFRDNDISDIWGNTVINLSNIEEFQGAWIVKQAYVEINNKDCFWIVLNNGSGVLFNSLIDIDGNVLLMPTREYITFYTWEEGYKTMEEACPMCAGLIMAKCQETNLYGFIDLTGNWVIPAQYEYATYFQGEGDDAVAVVNGNTIINRKGEVVYTIPANDAA